MRIELNSLQKNVCFAAVALALTLPYFLQIQKHYRAFLGAKALSAAGLEESIRLEPGNAEYHDTLGRLYLFALQDPKKADVEFLTAVHLDKNSSRYWLDLATTKGMLADTAAQRQALQNALKVDPKTPKVAWEAGNFFLVEGNTDAALDSFRTVIENDPLAVRPALELCWRATHDVHAILTHAMPPSVTPHLELLRLMMEQQQTASLMSVWRSLASLGQPFKVADTMPFAEHLIRQHDIADAQQVWNDMAKMSPSLRPATSDENLIVNGGFEEEILSGGFSWRLEPPAVQTIRIDTREFHAGLASVAFTFEGPAFRDYGFSQLVPAKPRQTYELSVAARSEEITSAYGPRIIVEDAFSHAQLAQGPEWQGTHGWNEEHVAFTTLPETKLVRIYLGREYGGGLIRGMLWLDDVRLYER